jgi:hypothetical protein
MLPHMVVLKSLNQDRFDRVYARYKARLDAKREDEKRALYKKMILPPIKRAPSEMSYKIRFPARRLQAVFGTAYPALSLAESQKTEFITQVVGSRFSLSTGYNGALEVERERDYWGWWRHYEYVFKIPSGKREAYHKAVEIEKFLHSVRRLGLLSPPRFWNRWLRSRRPSDTFLITGLDAAKVFAWLQENVQYQDYQLYSKFGDDISLAFRNPEYATMFKLTFGDAAI